MASSVCAVWRAKTLKNLFYLGRFRNNARIISTSNFLNYTNGDVPSKSKQQFSLRFEEFQKLRRKIRTQKRISGIPFAAVGLSASSMVSVMMNPNLFDATDPEQIQPIL